MTTTLTKVQTADVRAHRPPEGNWWENGVLYHIYPLSFQDSNGDGRGDLDGIRARLDYLSETLGVDAIWLSPIHPSPMVDFGYDITDYRGIDPVFGDLEAFDRLVAAVHERGMRILLDYVPTGTSVRHPWFQEASASRNSERRDWYTFRDGKGDGPPNNWVSVFGGSAWHRHERTGQWSLHSFLPETADLNWRNPDVKREMFDVLRFWLDRGVDGFRIDTPLHMLKHPEFLDNPFAETRPDLAYKDMGDWSTQLQVHNKEQPDIHGLFRELRAIVDEYDDTSRRFLIGETTVFDWTHWARYFGEALDELHMPFNFGLLWPDWTPKGLRSVVEGVESAVPKGAVPNWTLGNHDETRLATRLGEDRARAAIVLLFTLRGLATAYYGDEIGLPQAGITPGAAQDVFGRNYPDRPDLNRDGCRTPMQWDRGPNAGFTDGTPWLPPTTDHEDRNVQTQVSSPGSTLILTRKLIEAKRSEASLRTGSFGVLDDLPTGLFGFRRQHSDEVAFVLVNCTERSMPIAFLNGWMTSVGRTIRSSRSSDGSSLTPLDPLEAIVVFATVKEATSPA